MGDKRYFISEVSKMVGVEPHVLRYWEEELKMEIKRDDQGKRCYRAEDVETLKNVKVWKDKGMQLRAVKEFMPQSQKDGKTEEMPQIPGEPNEPGLPERPEMPEGPIAPINPELPGQSGKPGELEYPEKPNLSEKADSEEHPDQKAHMMVSADGQDSPGTSDTSAHIQQFEALVDDILERAMRKNNEIITRMVCEELLEELESRMALWQQDRLGLGESAAAAGAEKEGLRQRIRRWLERFEN